MTIEEWREEIQRMDHELAIATGRVKATADESELRGIRQRQADTVNWRLLAFQLAEPQLEALYLEHEAARHMESRHGARSRDDTAWWSKCAAWCVASGLLTLLIDHSFGLSGWVTLIGVLLLIGAGFCVVSAVLAHGDQPDTAVSMNLNAHIHELETTCKRCRDIDDFNAVKSLLAKLSQPVVPMRPRSAEVATRTR